MNSHRYGKLLAAGLSLLMVTSLAACSDDTSDNTPDKPTDNPTSQATGFAQDANTLVFGVVPDSVDTETNYQPLMDYIALKTGLSVKYYESTDYAALIEAAIAGKIDVASFSGFTYVIATNNGAKIVPISSIVTEAGAEPGYYSEAIVPLNSTITTLADFKGKKVCFVDPSSTSGYLFPSFELLKLGISAENDVTPVFAGKHDISVTKVAQGVECEAGFAEDSQVALSDAVRVIQRTHVPGAPIVVSDTLPDSVKTNLTQALANVTIDQIIAAGVAKADSDAFRSTFAATSPVNDAAYDLIRQICQQTGAKQCQA